jgi:hypothetical protein
MSYRLEAGFDFVRTASDDPTLNEFLDRVDEHLVDALGAKDVTIVSDAEESSFNIALLAEGDHEGMAFATALAMLRTAFHAENCETPDWPRWAEFRGAGLKKTNAVLASAAA